jgi:hypothetical protein
LGAHTRTWREGLWFGLAVAIGTSVAMLIGPAYLAPLPISLKVVIVVAGCAFIAAAAAYSRRRAH